MSEILRGRDDLRGGDVRGTVLRGVVKWFNDAKGFGFIEHETGKDVFVHYSVIESDGFKTLKDGEQVEYELKEGSKGLHAARVARVNAPIKEKKAEKTGESLVDQLEVESTSLAVGHAFNPIAPLQMAASGIHVIGTGGDLDDELETDSAQ